MTFNDIINLTTAGGGTIFKNPNYLNLFAVRRPGDVNKFNDTLYYYSFDASGNVTLNTIDEFTTDPGLTQLRAPSNSKGVAILKEGWYRKLWKLGKHKNSYNALVQYSPCIVFRDKNRDSNIDFDPSSVDCGVFGINLHRANQKLKSIQVDGWSAGCQVVADPNKFNNLMDAVYKANKAGQVYFSYMLVRSSSIIR